MKTLMSKLGHDMKAATILRNNNQSSIKLVKNLILHNYEQIEKNEIQVSYIHASK
uniref:Uncharacterized protein n=1 Tax=Physcomitrium patens TaxID=3218 RepID=A0A2K1JM91_PHYPA|nr:hypothetical protein PHYPA_017491 [Physcomitrium patens]